MSEHIAENLILELLNNEMKMTHAVNSGRGIKGLVARQEKIVERLSEELQLDEKYIKASINK